MVNGARNLLVLQTILEVDWYGTFSGKPMMNTGWYLYFDYQTGRVDGVPAWTRSGTEVFPAIEPKFHAAQQTTLVDWEAEVQWYLDEDRRQERYEWETRLRCEATEERVAPLSALWRNAFTACGIQTPVNAGEAVDRVVIALRGQLAVQDEVRALRPQLTGVRAELTSGRQRNQASSSGAVTSATPAAVAEAQAQSALHVEQR